MKKMYNNIYIIDIKKSISMLNYVKICCNNFYCDISKYLNFIITF